MKRRTRNKYQALVAPISFWDKPLASFILLAVSGVFLMISAINPAFFGNFRSGAANVFEPALSALSYPVQEVSGAVRNVTGLSEMQSRNAALEKENARLREWYQTALHLEDQNKALQELLNLKIEEKQKFITTRIIADPGNAFVKSVLVRAGTNDGVLRGNPVISGDGLVGRVVHAGARASRVLLLNDVNSRVPVMIEENDLHAVLAGRNDVMPALDHLPKDVHLEEGMRVVTSGFGGMFAPGIPVGHVVKGEHGGYAVRLLAGLENTQYVRIIQNHEDVNLISGDLQ